MVNAVNERNRRCSGLPRGKSSDVHAGQPASLDGRPPPGGGHSHSKHFPPHPPSVTRPAGARRGYTLGGEDSSTDFSVKLGSWPRNKLLRTQFVAFRSDFSVKLGSWPRNKLLRTQFVAFRFGRRMRTIFKVHIFGLVFFLCLKRLCLSFVAWILFPVSSRKMKVRGGFFSLIVFCFVLASFDGLSVLLT